MRDAIAAEAVRAVAERLRRARCGLARRPLEQILGTLDAVIASWLSPGSPWMERAVSELSESTGFSRPMLAYALPLLLEPLRGESMAALLDEEIGDRRRLDTADWAGPRLVAHVLPGNIPALAASAICLSLAAKAAALIKAPAEDRVFPVAFAESIAAADPELGDAAAVVYWRGGDAEVERAAFAMADVVEVAGGDEAVAAVRARAPGRVLGHGSKISFALLGAEVVRDDAALGAATEALGEDVSLWDQRGCLSPQVIFVEGGRDAVDRVAARLEPVLERWAQRLPPRRLALEEKALVHRFRESVEWRGGARLRCGAPGWALVLEDEPALQPTCLHRTVRVQPLADHETLARCLAARRPHLEAAGLAVAPARGASLGAALRAAGVHRVCAVGEMQRPDLRWKPSGLPRVASWLPERH